MIEPVELILLGAGASAEAGIPTTADMTRRILDQLKNSDNYRSEYYRTLNFVVACLKQGHTVRGDDVDASIDVEELFATIEALSNRDKLDISPFVQFWHPHLEELGRTALRFHRRPFNGRDFDGRLVGYIKRDSPYSPGEMIERSLKDIQLSGGSFVEQLFREITEDVVRELVRMTSIENAQLVRYLRPLVITQDLSMRRVIATLNYDNSVELAASEASIKIDMGIESWSKWGEWPTPPIGVQLIKLHGSADWTIGEGKRDNIHKMPFQEIRRIPLTETRNYGHDPALVFGQGNKLTAQGPFLDMLRAFRSALESTQILTIIGYSFRDRHINEYIGRWLNAGTESNNGIRKIRIANGTGWNLPQRDFTGQLAQLGNDQVEILDSNASVGIEEWFGS